MYINDRSFPCTQLPLVDLDLVMVNERKSLNKIRTVNHGALNLKLQYTGSELQQHFLRTHKPLQFQNQHIKIARRPRKSGLETNSFLKMQPNSRDQVKSNAVTKYKPVNGTVFGLRDFVLVVVQGTLVLVVYRDLGMVVADVALYNGCKD